jgi:hypothetical protein
MAGVGVAERRRSATSRVTTKQALFLVHLCASVTFDVSPRRARRGLLVCGVVLWIARAIRVHDAGLESKGGLQGLAQAKATNICWAEACLIFERNHPEADTSSPMLL